jgi:hypothetical protein
MTGRNEFKQVTTKLLRGLIRQLDCGVHYAKIITTSGTTPGPHTFMTAATANNLSLRLWELYVVQVSMSHFYIYIFKNTISPDSVSTLHDALNFLKNCNPLKLAKTLSQTAVTSHNKTWKYLHVAPSTGSDFWGEMCFTGTFNGTWGSSEVQVFYQNRTISDQNWSGETFFDVETDRAQLICGCCKTRSDNRNLNPNDDVDALSSWSGWSCLRHKISGKLNSDRRSRDGA